MVTVIDVRKNGVVGKLFLPDTSGPSPAIIVLSGSSGGFNERTSEAFAREGFASLALAYFNTEGLPQNLENIPLEYFLNGINWLKSQPQVNSKKIFLYGPSRGGELALLLASTFPEEFSSVVAVVPSCVTYGGIPNEKEPSWTFCGKPLPIAPSPTKEDVYKELELNKAINLTKIFLDKMQDKQTFNAAMIHVENIQCPLLLISGGEDATWPSWVYCDLIMQRLKKTHSKIQREHICYEHAGHMILSSSAPVITESVLHKVTNVLLEVGGNVEAQAAANKDSWEKILKFFEKYSQ